MFYALLHIRFQQAYYSLFTLLKILVTYIGRNCKTRRNRHTDKIHLCQIGTLATKEISHVSLTLCLTVTEGINSFFAHN